MSPSNEPFVVAHLSDLHVGEPATMLDELIGPAKRLERAVARLNDLGVDVVVATGDLVDRALESEYERLAELLAGLEARCILQPGNHDDVDTLVRVFRKVDHIDVGHLPPRPAPANFVIDDLPLRIVGVDTVQAGFHHGALDADRLGWLAATLATEPARPTLLCLHHVPTSTGMWWMDYTGFDGAGELEDIVRANPQIVRLLAGHIHRATDLAFGGTVLGVAPALTYESMPALHADSGPLINDDAPTIPLLRWDGERLVALHVPLDPPSLTLDLREVIKPWAAYESAARAGGPMPADGFGG
jgi:Icc protein